MASASVCSLLPTQFTISRTRPSLITPQVFQAPLTLGFKNLIRSQVRQKRLVTLLASNSNPQGGDSIKETSDGIAESNTSQGPPFLTILAGLVVFLLVCWVFGSFIIGVITLLPHFSIPTYKHAFLLFSPTIKPLSSEHKIFSCPFLFQRQWAKVKSKTSK